MEINLKPHKHLMVGAILASNPSVRAEASRFQERFEAEVKAAMSRRNEINTLILNGYPPEMAERIFRTIPFDVSLFLRIVGPYRDAATVKMEMRIDPWTTD